MEQNQCVLSLGGIHHCWVLILGSSYLKDVASQLDYTDVITGSVARKMIRSLPQYSYDTAMITNGNFTVQVLF